MDATGQSDGKTLAPTRAVAFIRRLARPMWLLVGVAATLEVPGRRTGSLTSVTVIPVRVDGHRYLMSMGGPTDWVLNLRAAGRGELRHRRRKQAFNAVEVQGSERDRAIAAYVAKLGPFKRDFDRRPGAEDHPTFRLDSIA